MDNFIVRALKIKQQDKFAIYSFFIEAKDIFKIADISRLKRDENDKIIGLQRKDIKKHINDITEYLNTDDVLFPNAIILAISNRVAFHKIRG